MCWNVPKVCKKSYRLRLRKLHGIAIHTNFRRMFASHLLKSRRLIAVWLEGINQSMMCIAHQHDVLRLI
ncbi:hypothetical protein HFRIS_000765 [Herbaspirillum frisingense GSF30]|uniref:Uncharacterized protein n=1 Tax=Herbaspirillum frisingense GSF30 TaxID=864073 RepID=A0AAI9N5T2_9BURK|nr:hypothetical protein HFRIS_000765 [Herbaspirillum frisingense GSF30]